MKKRETVLWQTLDDVARRLESLGAEKLAKSVRARLRRDIVRVMRVSRETFDPAGEPHAR